MIKIGKQLYLICGIGDSLMYGNDSTNSYNSSLKTFNYSLQYNQPWVWSKDNSQTNNGSMQRLIIGTNSGYNSQTQNITPLASLMHKLALDKDALNYMLVNYGVIGSTMSDIGGVNTYGTWDTNPTPISGTNSYLCYPHYMNYRLLPALNAAKNIGYDPIVTDFYIMLGTNDALNITKTNSYYSKAIELMNKIKSDLLVNNWATKYIKFKFIKPNANLNITQYVGRDIIRTNIDTLSNITSFDYSDTSKYPLTTDGVHWSNNSNLNIGYDLYANSYDDEQNQVYLDYIPSFSGHTQYWLAKNSRTGRTTTSTPSYNGSAVLGINFNVTSGEGGDQLIYSASGEQPNINLATPCGLLGNSVMYYKYDGGFVRILNTLNSQLGMKTPYNPVKNAPFEYMHVIRLNKGIVAYESVISGSFGLKYLGGSSWQLYSSYQGNDHFQSITWNASTLLDKIIILHFNMTSPTTMSFRISHPSVGDYYQGNSNWDVTFPVAKPLQNVVLGTTSHPIIADHFGGVIKSNGSFTSEERATNIAELKKLFPIKRNKYTKAYLAPTISYASNIFTLNPNYVQNGSPYSFNISNMRIRWWQYFKNNGVGSAIDNRLLMQSTDGNTYLYQDAGYTGNPLTYNRLAAGLVTNGNKADIVVEITDKNGYIAPFVTIPFGSYY